MGEREKYNFYVHGDIKEKAVFININPTHATDNQINNCSRLILLVYIPCEIIIATNNEKG